MRNRIKLNSTPVNNPISLKENILVINRIELTENSNLYCKKILADSYLSTVLTPKSVLSYEQKRKNNFFKNQETKVLDENEVTLEILKEPVEESTITQKKLNKRFSKKPNQIKRTSHNEKSQKKPSVPEVARQKSFVRQKLKQLDAEIKELRVVKKISQPSVKSSEEQELNVKRKEKGYSLDEIEKLIQVPVGSNEPSDDLAAKLKQLDKRQRMELFKKRLHQKPPATHFLEAYELINNTLIEIEDEFGPKSDDTLFYHSKKYGKMHPLSKEKIKLNNETGKHEMITVGFLIILNENGGFEFWTKDPVEPTKIFSKNGLSMKNLHFNKI